MSSEVWVEVEGFPGYAVSNRGRVMNRETNYILRPRDNSYGYSRVALRKDGKTHDVYVHRLVAKAFITGYHDGVQIRHKQDNSDNSVNNLRFRRGERMGTLVKRPKKAQARRIRIVETNQVFLSVDSCAKYIDGDASSIYRVLRGERETHKGFTFEYHYEEHDG
jgi:hypothetical protein